MEYNTFEWAKAVIDGTASIVEEPGKNRVPYYYRQQVSDILNTYTQNDSEYFKKAQELAIEKSGAIFAEKRDAIRWINGYGYDCKNEDITNFLASYIKLKDDYTTWLANGGEGQEPVTYYKVYTNGETMAKGVVPLTIEAFNQVYEAVRTSQFAAYAWLETVRAQINATHNIAELNACLAAAEITL